MKKISVVFGTRPEAIKLAPVILTLKTNSQFECHVCVTAQHREMLDQVLDVFEIKPDVDLNLMQPNQSLAALTSKAISAIDTYLTGYKPDMVIVQGDTTTVFCAALSAFYHQIPIGHVEAGLRTWNKYSPFPEEANRVLTTHLSTLHFAPTEKSKGNLIKEGVAPDKVFVTGNTVIDALYLALDKIKINPPVISDLPENLIKSRSPLVLITGHRRENFGTGVKNICQAIAHLADKYPQTAFVYPVHLNPNVKKPVFDLLSKKENIYLIKPLSYLPFVALMNRATLILTDSGGIQEEAPSLGKPVLVMRDTTERPEAVTMGTVKLVGTDSTKVIENVDTLLNDKAEYAAMANAVNPYGDGKATERIISACLKYFQ
ncbi:MAG: UDP-N-acetylglucosamine 2-epimerase (non-hydrolyzing) [Syntrophales bacterium]|nr:UDP-N-acetylglucosamine 2-epimerase (non-hydrolyzing) [Syntrophales bacterium]